MIENIHSRNDLIGFARKQAKPVQIRNIHSADVDEAIRDGWGSPKFSKNRKRARVSRNKPRPEMLESRVWSLLFRMGFDMLSGEGGSRIILPQENPESIENENQLDCVAIDAEVALAIECRTAQAPKPDNKFQERLSKFAGLRKYFAEDVKKQFKSDVKRQIGTAMFVWDLIQSDTDYQRASSQNVTLFDEEDLSYFEKLEAHLGVAARYQFLAEIFPGKPITGLEVKVPALQTKIGKFTAYTFAIRPEYLLKIAFVSHRAKGGATDLNAYQRMVSKKRLKQIRKYISGEDAYFPTNVVLNIEKQKYIRFDLGEQEGGTQGARVGWLYLSPTYKSAYVIDGQHRLFAYSGQKRAATSYLHVLAFDGLPGPLQAKLFVDINHEQKSVKTNLLDELWAELNWDTPDDEKRMRAIVASSGFRFSRYYPVGSHPRAFANGLSRQP